MSTLSLSDVNGNRTTRVSGGSEDIEKKEPKNLPSARPAGYAVNAKINDILPQFALV